MCERRGPIKEGCELAGFDQPRKRKVKHPHCTALHFQLSQSQHRYQNSDYPLHLISLYLVITMSESAQLKYLDHYY